MSNHDPRCNYLKEPPGLRDPSDCNCGAYGPPLRSTVSQEGRRIVLYWLQDPGHSWLVLPVGAVHVAQAVEGLVVTEYSYYSPLRDLAYLEEDVDALAFLLQGDDISSVTPERKARWHAIPTRDIHSFDDYKRRHGLVRFRD